MTVQLYLTNTPDLVAVLGVAEGEALELADGLGLKEGLGLILTSTEAAGANWLVYLPLNHTK